MRQDHLKKHGRGTLYEKSVTEVLQKQVTFCGSNDISFHPEQVNPFSRAASTILTMESPLTCYVTVKEVIASRDGHNLWIKNSDVNAVLFELFIQLCFLVTTTTLKNTALIVYSVNAILLKCLF